MRSPGRASEAPAAEQAALRVAWLYDMDACRAATGVTRHALAMARELASHEGVALHALTGPFTTEEGRQVWGSWSDARHAVLPLKTRDMLRLWRLLRWPPLESWTGPVDWVYCPAELFAPARHARLAVTSHDALQDVSLGGPARRRYLARLFRRADRILSVSEFNTKQLVRFFPLCEARTAYVPNAADDLFFEPPSSEERDAIRGRLGLPADVPYLLSVANFQPRKNLERFLRAAQGLPEVARGELAVVLVGTGSETESARLRSAVEGLGSKAVVSLPGYLDGRPLRAAYAEAAALVFPSTCESFGIPAVEAMAQGCPVALADSTALPEVAGAAGWYFDPHDEEAIRSGVRDLLDSPTERRRRALIGREQAARFRWRESCARLLEALTS